MSTETKIRKIGAGKYSRERRRWSEGRSSETPLLGTSCAIGQRGIKKTSLPRGGLSQALRQGRLDRQFAKEKNLTLQPPKEP